MFFFFLRNPILLEHILIKFQRKFRISRKISQNIRKLKASKYFSGLSLSLCNISEYNIKNNGKCQLCSGPQLILNGIIYDKNLTLFQSF